MRSARLGRGPWLTLWIMGGLLLVALLLGIAIDRPASVLALALAGCLGWTLAQLFRLRHWLKQHGNTAPPHSAGTWGDVYAEIWRRQRAARLQRQRLLNGLHAFREAAAALPDGVLILDRAGNMIWFNKAAKRLLGLAYPKDLGAPFTRHLPSTQVARWLEHGRSDEPLMDLASPTDDSIRLGLRMIPCGVDQRMLVVRDVSNLMRLEHVRRDFVANVSHELRTPLTVVHGYLDLIDPGEQPEWEPILRELRNQSRRMTQIVEDLLTLSRLEAQDSLPEDRVAMGPMLATLKREAEALSQGHHQIEVEREGEFDFLGSAKELHSAFSNLVTNAVRYTPEGGRIFIRWVSHGTGARFEVQDTGNGIPAHHIPRITERFYRVSTSRSRESGGTGLGLSIVKHVLSLHQGRLQIDSEVGKGSTFACIFGKHRLMAPELLTEEAE